MDHEVPSNVLPNTPVPDVFCVACNVCEIDKVLRLGGKCWVLMTGNQFMVRGRSRGGRIVEKTARIHRFNNFRALWLPVHERHGMLSTSGSISAEYYARRERFEATAQQLEEEAERERQAHPNRQGQVPRFTQHPPRHGSAA